MGIKERQERDREAVRRAILDAARELFVRDGFENVSMRKIAELVEYSPAAIYGYFPSKDDIFFALAEEGFKLLCGDRCDRGAFEALPPLDRVRAIFWRFYVFSLEHPQYFALMFVERSVPRLNRDYERVSLAGQLKQDLLAHVRAAAEAGSLPSAVPPEAIVRFLSAPLLGLATSRLSNRLAPDEDTDALARDLIEITIAGLQAGLPLRSSGSCCPLGGTEPTESVQA
ncbi:MAG: TetR/AcrR family transcriptional regulator [Vicinamibacterales bacterium]